MSQATGDTAGHTTGESARDNAGASELELREEVQRLRARLGELQDELVAVQAKANEAIAAAEDRAYWLDRWHVDLNAVMERPATGQIRGLLRAIRTPVRLLRRAMRALRTG